MAQFRKNRLVCTSHHLSDGCFGFAALAVALVLQQYFLVPWLSLDDALFLCIRLCQYPPLSPLHSAANRAWKLICAQHFSDVILQGIQIILGSCTQTFSLRSYLFLYLQANICTQRCKNIPRAKILTIFSRIFGFLLRITKSSNFSQSGIFI